MIPGGWMEKAYNGLRDIAAAANAGATALSPGTTRGATSVQNLDPRAVLKAVAEAMKSDNVDTQALAIRIVNLQSKYPNKAA